MTLRAVILGMLGAVLIAAVGYVNDQVLNLVSITDGRLLPVIVFGSLTLAMLTVGPLLGKVWPGGRFKSSELAIIVALMLIGCSIPTGGLFGTFVHSLALPAHHQQQSPGWQEQHLLDYAPPSMLPAEGRYDDTATRGLLMGLGKEGEPIGLGDVPWHHWRAPLMTWMPMVVLAAACMVCLGLIVHRQWSVREHLRYPIAEFATSLMAQDGRAFGPIFRDRLFLVGFLTVLAIRTVNGLNAWYPDTVPRIPLMFNFGGAAELVPWLTRDPWGWDLFFVYVCPIAVAFSFFLASDIALSLGLSQWIFIPISAFLITRGVDISSGYLSGGAVAWQRFGSYLAFAGILLYAGRHYYRNVLIQAVTFRRRDGVEAYAGWACRVLIAAAIALAAIMVSLGLDWLMAVLMVLLMLLMFVGTARIAAETGLFYIMPRWLPVAILFGLYGAYAMGPGALVILGMLCVVLCLDPGSSIMPYFVNALRICDLSAGKAGRFRPGRIGLASMGVYVAGVAVAVPVVLWAAYNFGLSRTQWRFDRVPTMTFRMASEAVTRLSQSEDLAGATQLGWLERILNIDPSGMFLWSAGAGVALVLVIGVLRLRMPRWPIHPIIFLVWQTWPMARLHHSFMLGWVLKTLITRFGGHGAYGKAKALMIGVIAADMLAGLGFMIAGAIYHAVTGLAPARYAIIPM
ncbi:MAG: DUF6785 family protein [Planctomycetota bacterium]|jgi:hypothetical protein